MIHMLSSFDLKSDEDFDAFARDYEIFLDDLRAADMIADAGSLGQRVEATPMNTDAERTQSYFSVMTFRDRARPGTQTHLKMYRRLTNTVFLCWEDTDARKDTA